MKKWLLSIPLVVLFWADAQANDYPTNISTFTWTQVMDTAGAAGAKHRNDTLYTAWCYVGDMKRVKIAVQRVPVPLYKDTTWASNVNDSSKIYIQQAFAPVNWNQSDSVVIWASKRPVWVIPWDSLANTTVYDTTYSYTDAQYKKLVRDTTMPTITRLTSGTVFCDWIRGMVIVHDSTKTTVASVALRGNKYSRQFIFWINGLRYSK